MLWYRMSSLEHLDLRCLGVLVCHFEAQSFDDQGRLNSVVLRVDRILERAVQDPSLPVTIPEPTPGELLYLPYYYRVAAGRGSGPQRVYNMDVRPWALSLHLPNIHASMRRALQSLYEAERDGGTMNIQDGIRSIPLSPDA